MAKPTITREQAEEVIEGLDGLISRGVQSVYLDMAIAGMRQLIATLDSDPYWWAIENRHGDARFAEGEHTENNILDEVHELNEKDDNGEYFDDDAPYKAVPVYRSPVVAAHEQEPVAWRWRSGPDKRWHLASRGDLAGEVEPLYRHAQPVPEAMPECFRNAVSALESLYRNGQKQCWHERYTTDMAYASGVLNACRAAMLSGGKP